MTKAKEWFAQASFVALGPIVFFFFFPVSFLIVLVMIIMFQVRQKVAFVEQTGTRSDLRVCLNIIITGNPGTGKTTFARLLARFFHTYGVLPKDSFVEKNGFLAENLIELDSFCRIPGLHATFCSPVRVLACLRSKDVSGLQGLELKAEFMGGTAPRVKAAVQEAMGGCSLDQ